jgi:hypothetical protein
VIKLLLGLCVFTVKSTTYEINMPYLNLNYSLIVYEDQSDKNPKVKLPDLSISIAGVQVSHDTSHRVYLAPGEVKDIAVTSRALGWDSTTQILFDRYAASGDNVRIKWTGTGLNPAFRVNRNIGGAADTVVDMTRITPYVLRITQSSGTAFSLGSVVNGDYLKFEKSTDAFISPFNVNNQGRSFLIQAKGANYIDIVDNGTASLDTAITLGADFAFALRAYSAGPIKIGDTISISGSGINPSNHGKFDVVDVSPDYIEIVNPFGYGETVLYGTNNLTVYDYLIGFLHARASTKISLRYDAQVEWAAKSLMGPEVVVLESPSSYRIQARNDDPVTEAVISVQYGRIIG